MNEAQDAVMTADTARKILSVVDQGRCFGLGGPILRMGAGPAVCFALGLPRGVDPVLRLFGIMLNSSPWCNQKTRTAGMRKLAVAQLGSLGQIDSIKFVQHLAEQTIRRILPPMLRQIGLDDAADRCEQEGTEEAANAAADRAAARYAANARAAARYAAARDDAYHAADAAAYATEAAFAARAAADAAATAEADARAARRAAESAYASDDAEVLANGYAAAATNAAANAVAYAAYAAATAAEAADSAADAYADAYAEAARDGVLTLMCDICIDILRDMEAPGIALMDQVC